MNTDRTNNQETFLDSSIPLWHHVRVYIFKADKPDLYTQATFYLNLGIWSIFFLWSLVSYIAVSFRQLIFDQKGIPVETIITNRGIELGMNPMDFLDRLQTFHAVSLICWAVVLVGLIFLWRKETRFVYFFFVGTVFYLGMTIFYLNWNYYIEDTTFFDKITFLAMNLMALVYYFLLKKEQNGGSISFFGEEED